MVPGEPAEPFSVRADARSGEEVVAAHDRSRRHGSVSSQEGEVVVRRRTLIGADFAHANQPPAITRRDGIGESFACWNRWFSRDRDGTLTLRDAVEPLV